MIPNPPKFGCGWKVTGGWLRPDESRTPPWDCMYGTSMLGEANCH
jgi:hypothetical protein